MPCVNHDFIPTQRSLFVFNYDHFYPSFHMFRLIMFLLPRKSFKKRMMKKHFLSSVSLQSDNGRKRKLLKEKERNFGRLATPISLVFSKNKIDFRVGQTMFQFWICHFLAKWT